MQQTIDIELFKENPQLLFAQLPKQAEQEINKFMQFIVFKYNSNLVWEIKNEKDSTKVQNAKRKNKLLDAFEPLRTGLPEDYKFNREEANER